MRVVARCRFLVRRGSRALVIKRLHYGVAACDDLCNSHSKGQQLSTYGARHPVALWVRYRGYYPKHLNLKAAIGCSAMGNGRRQSRPGKTRSRSKVNLMVYR
jgi:hypothetical protein